LKSVTGPTATREAEKEEEEECPEIVWRPARCPLPTVSPPDRRPSDQPVPRATGWPPIAVISDTALSEKGETAEAPGEEEVSSPAGAGIQMAQNGNMDGLLRMVF
jgi:hypothetical protein